MEVYVWDGGRRWEAVLLEAGEVFCVEQHFTEKGWLHLRLLQDCAERSKVYRPFTRSDYEVVGHWKLRDNPDGTRTLMVRYLSESRWKAAE